MQNIKPQNPVTLGLCNEPDLQKALTLAIKRAKKAGIEPPKPALTEELPAEVAEAATQAPPEPENPQLTAENLFKPAEQDSPASDQT